MENERIARLLMELTACRGKCRCADCDCFVGLLMEVQDLLDAKGITAGPARRELDEFVAAAGKGPFHSCLGCDPCLPVEPYQELLKLLS